MAYGNGILVLCFMEHKLFFNGTIIYKIWELITKNSNGDKINNLITKTKNKESKWDNR